MIKHLEPGLFHNHTPELMNDDAPWPLCKAVLVLKNARFLIIESNL